MGDNKTTGEANKTTGEENEKPGEGNGTTGGRETELKEAQGTDRKSVV